MPKSALAFSTPGTSYQFQFEQAITSPEMNLQSFVNETLKAVPFSIATSIVGCFSCTAEERQKNPGFILSMGGVIAGIYASPPASGVQYLAYLGNRLGIVQPAYAQGQTAGFQTMEKILPVWTAFRNLAYVLFVLIFVFMGFAIMFRVKISPQAVITIQSALPRIVIGLILVTFSYAIVGFMIDLMYVVIYLINGVFRDIYINHFGSLGDLFRKLFESLDKLNIVVFGVSAPLLIKTVYTNFVFFSLIPALALITVSLMGPVGWLFGIIVVILIFIALLRCLWTLLKAYAMIIVNLIFAPFLILMGVLPGSNATGNWFRNTLANIAVLPTMTVMFFLSSYLIFVGIVGLFTNPLTLMIFLFNFIPGVGPLLASLGFTIVSFVGMIQAFRPIPSFWQFFSIMLLPLMGMVILLMAPKVSDMIQAFLAGKPFAYGTAIGETLGEPPKYALRGISIATEIGKAWTTRFGTRTGAVAGPPTGELPIPETATQK
ncbi:MAG: hypothetical protein ACOZBZ_00890 [Patescibacteria group bacterium]